MSTTTLIQAEVDTVKKLPAGTPILPDGRHCGRPWKIPPTGAGFAMGILQSTVDHLIETGHLVTKNGGLIVAYPSASKLAAAGKINTMAEYKSFLRTADRDRLEEVVATVIEALYGWSAEGHVVLDRDKDWSMDACGEIAESLGADLYPFGDED